MHLVAVSSNLVEVLGELDTHVDHPLTAQQLHDVIEGSTFLKNLARRVPPSMQPAVGVLARGSEKLADALERMDFSAGLTQAQLAHLTEIGSNIDQRPVKRAAAQTDHWLDQLCR